MSIQSVKTPFQKMSFTPDIPSGALGPNEYNSGLNVETDTRGIKKILGEQDILSQIPESPIFVTGSFRGNDTFNFIVATTASTWYSVTESTITNITPTIQAGGIQNLDPLNNRIGTGTTAVVGQFNNVSQVSTSGTGTGATFNINIPSTGGGDYSVDAYITIANGGKDYLVGDTIVISGADLGGATPANDMTITVPATYSTKQAYKKQYTFDTRITTSWNGNVCFIMDTVNPPMYLLTNATEIRMYDIAYSDQYPTTYVWNYYANQGWTNVSAGFQRVYSSPNIGSILVAGNLHYTAGGQTYQLPNTLRWSQNFGLNSGPTTWAPTYTNTANEVEIPVRGPIVDGFPLNGNFYIFSYWDCAILQPITYQSSSAPVFGISPVTQGRGLINENCWAINDSVGFGVDSSDVWMLNGGAFTEIGNQRVKNWFYGNLNPSYVNQVFMANNTFKNQIEIYYPDLTSIDGRCNKMLSYRYDLDCWNAPRDVHNAVMACEAPVYDPDTGIPNIANRGVVYARGANNSRLVQKDVTNGFFNGGDSTLIDSYFRRDNINFGEPYSNRVQVHRVLPEVYGTGTFTIQVGGADSVGQTPTFKTTATMYIATSNPWIQTQQNTQRVSSIIAGTNDSTGTWIMSQANWQISITEDTR